MVHAIGSLSGEAFRESHLVIGVLLSGMHNIETAVRLVLVFTLWVLFLCLNCLKDEV